MNNAGKRLGAFLALGILTVSLLEVGSRLSEAWEEVTGRDWNLRLGTPDVGVNLRYQRQPDLRVSLGLAETALKLALRYQGELAWRWDREGPLSLRALLDLDVGTPGVAYENGFTTWHYVPVCYLTPRHPGRGIHLRYNC